MIFFDRYTLKHLDHSCRAIILKKNPLWLPPFFMAVATSCFYEKVHRTMGAAIALYLLKTKNIAFVIYKTKLKHFYTKSRSKFKGNYLQIV